MNFSLLVLTATPMLLVLTEELHFVLNLYIHGIVNSSYYCQCGDFPQLDFDTPITIKNLSELDILK